MMMKCKANGNAMPYLLLVDLQTTLFSDIKNLGCV